MMLTHNVKYLDNLLERFPNVLWLWDLNFDLLKRDQKSHKYNTILTGNNMSIINHVNIDNETYFHPRSGFSIVDHAFTDMIDKDFNVYVKSCGFTDHDALVVNYRPTTPSTDRSTHKYAYDNRKIDSLMHLIVTESQDMDAFITNCQATIQSCKYVRRKNDDSDSWMTEEIKNLMKKRDHFKYRSQRYRQNEYLKTKYTSLRNLVTFKVRQTKRDFYHNQFENCRNDSKKTWRFINSLIYDSKRVTKDEISEIMDDDGCLLKEP